MLAAKILIAVVLVFVALGLVCAIVVSRPRGQRIGRRPHRQAADPHFYPYGDMPGFSREQLEAIARRPVELHHDSSRPMPANLNARQLFNAPPKKPFGRGRRAF